MEPKDESKISESRNNVYSGPVSDDTPSEAYETRDENDEEVFRNKRQSFSYISTAKKNDRVSRVMRNPEDNIRYLKKDSETDEIPKKREPEPELRPLTPEPEEEPEKLTLKERIDLVKENFHKFKNELFGIRNANERHQGFDLKSVPEVEYFSADDLTDDEEENDASEKKRGFFRRADRESEEQHVNHVEDYNEPNQASAVLEDLYSLKTNLTVKFFIQLVATLISVYLSASAAYHIPVPAFVSNSQSPHKFSFAMFMISAVVLFTSFPMVVSGLKNLFRKKADCDSLAAVSITACTIAAAVSTESPELIETGAVSIFAPVAITAFLANTVGKHMIVNRAINNFDMLISSFDKHSLVYVENESRAEQLTKGIVADYPILAAVRKTGFAKDFLKYSYSADIADKLCRNAVPAALFVSVVFTLLSVLVCSTKTNTLNFTFVTSVFSMFISICSCFGIPMVVNQPLAEAASEAEENESLILGYQSVDDFYDTNSLIIDSSQIFPDSTLKLCSIKTYSDTRIDEALVAAASLVIRSDSIFSEMFDRIIDHKTSLLENVENFFYEDGLGLCGWIKNKRVLFGTRDLMINHNIEGIPPVSKEEEITEKGRIPVYLSVSGNLAAVFSVKLKADTEVSECLGELSDNGISLLVRNRDSIITEERIAGLFRIPVETIRVIPFEHTDFCDRVTSPVAQESSSVICTGTLYSLASVISNIKHIYNSALTGLVLQGTSALLALFFVIIFMFTGTFGHVTPLLVILYHTLWIFLTLFIMKVKPR